MKASKAFVLPDREACIRADRFFRGLCVGCGQERASVAANAFLPERSSHCARCAWEPGAFQDDPVPIDFVPALELSFA